MQGWPVSSVEALTTANYAVCHQTDSARVNRSTNLVLPFLPALGAADPHGLDDCPNSVLPVGFDMLRQLWIWVDGLDATEAGQFFSVLHVVSPRIKFKLLSCQ